MMPFNIVHLIDDVGLGGVTRSLSDQLPRHRSYARHEILRVDAEMRLPPRIDADLVVVHFTASWAKMPFLWALRRQMGSRPIVLQEHSYTEMFERLFVPRRSRFRRMLRLSYGFADVVVAVSQGQASWIRSAALARPDKVLAIPQALDTSSLNAIPPPVPRPDSPIRFGAYGRYVPQKGFDILIDAFRTIDPAYASLRLAGYGPDEAMLRQRASGMPHVEIEGRLDGPARFLSETDVALIPSRYEAFGLVAAEIRAAARPFIATSVDGLVEQIDPAWALPCKPLDASSLRDAILSFAGCDITAMGLAARASVQQQLSTNIREWASLYAKLVRSEDRSTLPFCMHAPSQFANASICQAKGD